MRRTSGAEAIARYLDGLGRDDVSRQLGAAFALIVSLEEEGGLSPLAHEITMRQQDRIARFGTGAYPLSWRQCELIADIVRSIGKRR